MFKKSILDEIRQRTSIVKLIGERIPLKRSGRNFKANCPFHNEKTPSFMVSDEKGIYHCFGCGEGGDAFQFVMKFDGTGFSDAVRYLASKAGVEIEEETDPGARAREDEATRRRRMLLRVNEIAREYFQGNLADASRGKGPRDYLQTRGITGEIFKQHLLGLADDSWDSLVTHLGKKNVPLELASQLGLVRQRDQGGYYDFFRDRLIFPILTPRGETIGFGGRALSEEGEGAAKYINSPDSPIYHKSASVYGLDRAAGAIRSADQVVLVEGYMDFIALHQAGIGNVAAPLGTALTQGHVSVLARYTRNMVLVFDGDEAGRRAAVRALPVFIESGIMPRVVVLPAGEDPDSMVRKEGVETFRERIERAKPLFEHFVEVTVGHTGLDSAGKSEALRAIVPVLRKVDDAVDATLLKQHVARRLDVEEQVIARAVGSGARSADARLAKNAKAAPTAETADAEISAERLLVETMLRRPKVAGEVFERISPANLGDEWCRTVTGILMDSYGRSDEIDVREVIESLDDEELAKQMRAVALRDESEGDEQGEEAQAIVSDCVSRILTRPARVRIEEINEDIRRAENEGDEERMLALLAEKKELVEKVHSPGNG